MQNMGLRERKKRETRQRLLDAAESMFSQRYFDDVTIESIVEQANVSQKTFFNYFSSKSQLLKELLLDWMKSTQQWPASVEPGLTAYSAITPSNIDEILDWVVEHRRILKMAVKHTDFFDYIYVLDRDAGDDEYHLFSRIRRPRLLRVERAQERGLLRADISARGVCNLYDSLRMEVVRRWLYQPDELATREALDDRYYEAVEVLISGLALERAAIPETAATR